MKKFSFILFVVILAGCSSHQVPPFPTTQTSTAIPLPPQAVDLGTYGLGAAKDMMWSSDGKMLVVESSAGGYVYDTSTWNVLTEIPRSIVQDGWFSQLTFFPDQQRLLFVAGYNTVFWQFDLHTQKISRAFENIGQKINTLDNPVFSPDGKLFVVGSSICSDTGTPSCRQALFLYDANTGELLHRLPENGLDQWGDMSAYVFSPDSSLIASGGEDDIVRVWDVAGGTLQYQFQHESDVKSLSFSPDGKVLTSAGLDATVRFWDMQNGKSLYTLHGTVDEFYQSAAYIDDGRKLLVNCSDGKFQEYVLDEHYLPTATLDIRFETEKRLMTEMGQYTPELIYRVSPDGQQVAVLINGTIKIWDLQNGKETYSLPEYIREVYVIGFSPDENLLAVADQNVHLWQIQPKRFLGTLEVNGNEVIDIAFHPDGKQAAFALLGGSKAEIWDLTQRRKLHTIVSECPDSGIAYSRRAKLAYSSDGSKLAFSGGCTTVIADAATGKTIQQFPNDLGESTALSFSTDGRTLIYVSVNGYRAWDVQTGKPIYSLKRVDDYQNSAALSSSLLAITSWNDPIRFIDPLTGKRLYEFPSGRGQNEIAISRDGRILALDNYSRISLLDSSSGTELLSMDFDLPYTIAFSPMGKYVGARSYSENVHLWEVSSVLSYAQHLPSQTATPNVQLTPTALPTPTPAPTLEISMPTAPVSMIPAVNSVDAKKLGELGIGQIHTMAWSPDGKLLAAGGYPGVYLFHAGEAQPSQFLPAKSVLLVMQFSSDGRYLAGQVSNDSILLWDLKSNKTPLTLENMGCWNQGMEFSPDNDTLTADCGDRKYTWRVESGAIVNTQTQTLKDDPISGPYTLRTGMRNVRLIRAGSGEIVKTFEIPGMAPSLARFSPDGKTLAVWQYEYQIARTGVYYPVENSKTILQLWNIYPDREPSLRAKLSTGIWQQELMILEAFQGLAFSSDSRLLATASGDGTTQIWNVATGRLLNTLPNGSKIYFSPNNKYLATLDNDSAHIWNISSSKPQIIWQISGFNRWSYDLAFAKDGQELVDVTDEYYKFFPVINTNLTAPSYQIKLPGKRGYQLALSADGSRMAYNTAEEILIGENNGKDPNWQVLTKFAEPLAYDRDLGLTFSSDGSLLVSDDPDDQKRVWDLKTMKSITLENPASTVHVYITDFLFSPDGNLLFGGHEPSTYEPSELYLWDTHTGKLVRYWTAQIYKFAFHPTEPYFVGADFKSGMIRFFDLRMGDLVKELRASQYIRTMVFSPDGKLLVLGYDNTGLGDEGRVEIHDAETLNLLCEIPKAGISLAFSPDGDLLAIGLSDGRIEYWEITVK